MSYRTYIENTQVFGNNEYHKEWADFLQSKGIEISEDGIYDGEIDDVMGLFEVVDKITKRLIAERHQEVLKGETFLGKPLHELTDLSDSMWFADNVPILRFNQEMIKNAYCFLPYQVYMAVVDRIEPVGKHYENDGVEWEFCTYKLKDGEKIHVKAY